MKATREKIKPPFTPVVITLETQEEVDQFYTMVNTSQITQVLNINNWYEKVEDYASDKVGKMHADLQNIFDYDDDDE